MMSSGNIGGTSSLMTSSPTSGWCQSPAMTGLISIHHVLCSDKAEETDKNYGTERWVVEPTVRWKGDLSFVIDRFSV
jgi:hypothetical protein